MAVLSSGQLQRVDLPKAAAAALPFCLTTLSRLIVRVKLSSARMHMRMRVQRDRRWGVGVH